MRVEDDISQFFTFILEEKGRIDILSSNQHRRVLLLSLLDTLAKCAFPTVTSNRERFLKLIDSYSGWPDKDRVSLPLLKGILRKSPHTALHALDDEVDNRLAAWPRSRILRPSESDPLIGEFKSYTLPDVSRLIKEARYASLLWTFRNFAVHEFRSPGHGFEFSDDNSSPYYHHVDLGKGGLIASAGWALYLPWQVISGLVSSCAESLRADCVARSVNPYDSFDFGPDWFS